MTLWSAQTEMTIIIFVVFIHFNLNAFFCALDWRFFLLINLLLIKLIIFILEILSILLDGTLRYVIHIMYGSLCVYRPTHCIPLVCVANMAYHRIIRILPVLA